MDDIRDRLVRGLDDRYEVGGLAGEGGMSFVFQALDRASGRQVAVKVFRPELSSELTEERFLREVRISAELDHPNVLPVLDSGSTDGLLYFVMPLVDGETLHDRLDREGPLPLADALAITRQVTSGLQAAHEAGFIHRDVKPANIMLASTRAMIADFGVARALEEAGKRLTKSGFSIGTPLYMSPEQGAGDPSVDGRSDQYSLACTLFEMLAGEPPFTGPSSRGVIARHIQEPPPSVEVVRPGVPETVAWALRKALSKTPADRFSSVADFVDALDADELPPGVGRATASGAVRPPGESHDGRGWLPWAVVLGGAAIVAYVLLSGRAELDPNRVVIFPPLDAASPSGVNDPVAVYIPYVLEGTDPLRWEEGRDWLERDQSVGDLTLDDQVEISRDAGAGYFIDGSVIESTDSLTVVLRLFDVAGRTLVERAGRSGVPSASAPQLGARAMTDLLAAIVEPGRRIDLGALADRRPAAIAHFYQGELDYRQTHFDSARVHYEDALAADPLFALAAVKGAQAASWAEDDAAALDLAGVAIRNDSLLPLKYRRFVEGIARHEMGRADSAVVSFRSVLDSFPDWAEAHTALGETLYHLIPDEQGLDFLAQEAFREALRLDSAFSPPRYHLAELAIRDGHLDEARRMIQELEARSPDRLIEQQLRLMADCAESGPSGVDWTSLADTASYQVIAASEALSVAPELAGCAEAGVTALIENPNTSVSDRWGAWLVLHGLLVSQGRADEVLQWTGSPHLAAVPSDRMLLVSGALDETLAAAADQVYLSSGTDFEAMTATNLWLMLQWASASERHDDLLAIAEVLVDQAAAAPTDRRAALFGRTAEAHLALGTGTTSERALELLAELRPTAVAADVQWQPWEALAPERMLEAELLLEAGRASDARRILADVVSHRAVIQLMYSSLREELLRRANAASTP